MYLKPSNEGMFSPFQKETLFDFIEVIPYCEIEKILVEVKRQQAALHEIAYEEQTMSSTSSERRELQRIQTLILDLEAELFSRRRAANAIGAVL